MGNIGQEDPAASALDPKPSLVEDILEVEDRYYILATSALADTSDRVLKHGDTFGVFDRYGDIKPIGLGEEGIFHEGTRYLSAFLLRLGRERPLMLSSNVRQDNALLAVDLTNPDIFEGERLAATRDSVHLARTVFIWDRACHVQLTIRNFGSERTKVPLDVRFAADFADIFEVRGTKRERRGRALDPLVNGDTVVLGYEGLDDRVRRTRLDFVPHPAELSSTLARFQFELEPQGEVELSVVITCDYDASLEPRRPDRVSRGVTGEALAEARQRGSELKTSNPQFNSWLERSSADLAMLTTETDHGDYPYAGIPWFSTPFGRDGLITAMECLWIDPTVARGVLSYLAATQASTESPEQDAQPGKIMHEARKGEMAALGEIPFGCYYGSVDSTPLFVMLAAAYHRRTGDTAFARQLWPNVHRALEWMQTYGDADGDSFLEYRRQTSQGLSQQGWKDSVDSVFHADGRIAEGPVALCEVQGYAYAALRGAADLSEAIGEEGRAERLRRDAERLRQRFEEAFWIEELGTYAIALDGRKRPCRVRTSNAGQCLLSGIVDPDRAERVASVLMSEAGYSGWGVRTLAAGEPRYNPMSYHNGSVWPHDNAMIAMGLANYGFKDAALRITESFFSASQFIDLRRLPELFCGFDRRPDEAPTGYPVACSPQAWASGSVFMLLQASLGLTIDAPRGEVRFSHPHLPAGVDEIWISNLRVGAGSLDLALRGHVDDVGISVLRKHGEVEVIAVK